MLTSQATSANATLIRSVVNRWLKTKMLWLIKTYIHAHKPNATRKSPLGGGWTWEPLWMCQKLQFTPSRTTVSFMTSAERLLFIVSLLFIGLHKLNFFVAEHLYFHFISFVLYFHFILFVLLFYFICISTSSSSWMVPFSIVKIVYSLHIMQLTL